MIEEHPRIRVIGIAGPGDPFANPTETLGTLRLVRRAYPDVVLCVATNGLALPSYVDVLAEHMVSHVTITVNAVDPAVGENLYAWVRDRRRVLRGIDAAALLIERQLEAIRLLKQRGIIVKINTIIVPHVNQDHAEDVARTVASAGADIINCIPVYPVAGSDMEHVVEPSADEVERIRRGAGKHLALMRHCARCRADAIGMLGVANSEDDTRRLQACSVGDSPSNARRRPNIAVATMEGRLINEHLGRASEFHVYTQSADGPVCIDRREAPAQGGGDERWEELARRLEDCRAVLVSSAGPKPRAALAERGLTVHVCEGLILPAVRQLFDGRPLPVATGTGELLKCGGGCGGGGGGCAA